MFVFSDVKRKINLKDRWKQLAWKSPKVWWDVIITNMLNIVCWNCITDSCFLAGRWSIQAFSMFMHESNTYQSFVWGVQPPSTPHPIPPALFLWKVLERAFLWMFFAVKKFFVFRACHSYLVAAISSPQKQLCLSSCGVKKFMTTEKCVTTTP